MEFSDIRGNELLDTLQIGVVVHAPDTSVLYANPKALELLSLHKDQAMGASAFDPQWHFLNQYGTPMRPEDYPVNQVIARKAALKDLQVGTSDGSGKIIWTNCNAYPEPGPNGEIARIIVHFIDITAQKEAVPYKDIVNLSNDAIIVTDAKSFEQAGPEIIYANQAFYELTGYGAEEVIGNDPLMLQGEQTDPKARQRIREALAKQEPARVTILNYRKSGTAFWNEISLFPLKNQYGEVVHFVCVQHDASARKKREESIHAANHKLHQQNLELKTINEQKNEILGIVAHDLRNPLYAMLTSFELVGELIGQNDPELFSVIDTSLNYMNATIQDLVESQTLHAGEMAILKEPHPIDELIYEVGRLNMQNASKKAISLHTQVPAGVTAFVDYAKLQRALDNLVSNAIKFSPTRSQVIIGCEVIDLKNVRLFVDDSGPGLTAEDMDKVFAPFQRLSARPTGGESSTGLGLSIVKKIVQLHGGEVGVVSEPQKGARFFMDIPLHTDAML